MNTYRKIITGIVLTLMIAGEAFAAKWQTLTLSDDIAKGIEELNQYCIMHDMKPEDVLWANKTNSEELKAGQVIYLPQNQADMLSIWQNIGAWKPTALVPVNSAAAANRLVANEKPKPKIETPAPKTEEPEIDLKNLFRDYEKPKQQPEPKAEITPQKPAPSPSNVIRETARPDKILTAKPKKAQPEIPGLMDPIIILSPNGDPTHGPMRLMISGDKVEVVRLPQNAVPKRPSVSDLNQTLGTSPGYSKYYDVTNLPKTNNYIPPNMVRLNGKMMWPVDGKVSSPFGKWRGRHMHQGIDIPMPLGTPIRAANTGIVARTGNNSTMGFRGYGNFILVDHGSGVQTFYAHCSSTAVREGQRIMQGQIIGYVGCTGRSTANHLHFEVRVNNTKVDPMPYLGGSQRLASQR